MKLERIEQEIKMVIMNNDSAVLFSLILNAWNIRLSTFPALDKRHNLCL